VIACRALLLVLALAAADADPQIRRVFVTALDANGAPVVDLTAADFAVKEGGKPREITRAGPALGPMQIAILVDDNGTGLFRVAVARFIEALFGRAEFSISTVTGQTMRLVDYTTSNEALSGAIGKLGARPASPDGGQLLEGILEASQDLLKRNAGRPIILALTVGGEEHTPTPAHHALDQLRQSGAALYVVSVVGSTLRASAAATKPSDLLNENLSLGEVLGDGPKRSGGHREEIAALAGVDTGLRRLAESLKSQYLIEYALPDGVKPSDRLSVSVKRKGITLRAPTYIPTR
jgi:VWFA-related protein